MWMYMNGEIVAEHEARISPFDHGYLYGLGAFETMRLYCGHPFLLEAHLARLQQAVDELNIQFDVQSFDWRAVLSDLLTRNALSDAYVRINVSAGAAPLGLPVTPYEQPTIIILMKEAPPLPSEKRAVTVTIPRNTPEGAHRLKSHHYLNNVLAKREVGPDLTIEGIMLTADGFVAEGVVSNIFWRKGEVVYTPSLQTGILAGVTRAYVIEQLRANGIVVEEGCYSVEHWRVADESFMTNGIQEAVSFTAIDDVVLTGERRVVALLKAAFRRDCMNK